MNRLLRALVITDWLLLTRIAIPFSHWVDWRFHRSPYQQAKGVIAFAQVLQICGVVMSFHVAIWWVTPMMVMVTVFLH